MSPLRAAILFVLFLIVIHGFRILSVLYLIHRNVKRLNGIV